MSRFFCSLLTAAIEQFATRSLNKHVYEIYYLQKLEKSQIYYNDHINFNIVINTIQGPCHESTILGSSPTISMSTSNVI